MSDKSIKKYLKDKGIDCNWTVDELRKIMIDPALDWEGEMCGGLIFNKTKTGKRYVQFAPGRCYID